MQIKEQKVKYFMNYWNLLDSSQFLLFFILYCIKMRTQFQTDSLPEILLSAFLLFQTFYKMIYFLRIFEGFNNTYQISLLIVKDLFCLMILAGMFILAFTKQYTVMHNGINDPTGEYNGIRSHFLKLIIQTYKSTRGDFDVPTLDPEFGQHNETNKLYSNIMITLNMVVVFVQEAIFIILGAVFYSQVLQKYEQYTPLLPTYMYKTMAKFNNECFDIVDMFVPQRNFKVVCFALSRNNQRNNAQPGFTGSIKNKISNFEDKLRYERDVESKEAEERHIKLLDCK